MVDMLRDSVEELSFPEKCSESELNLWSRCRHKDVLERPARQVVADLSAFLLSDQHQQGLSHEIKRSRRNKSTLPDLIPKVNPALPAYLQDVERYNVELMRPVQTTVKCLLPTVEVIKQEKDVTEMELEKVWEHGLVLTNQETLIDPKWGRAAEDEIVDESNRQKLVKSPSVITSVLRRWPV